MFVPCDENGNILEVPKYYGKKYTDDIPEIELILHEEFIQAKEKCIFEKSKYSEILVTEFNDTIEDLTKMELYLTKQTIKKL